MISIKVTAFDDINVASRVQEYFSSSSFRVYASTDVIGAELGGHSGDAGAFTGMSVIATNAALTELVTQAAAVKANLTAAAVFTFVTPFTLLVGEIINYHVYGAASTLAGPFVVSVTYRPLTPFGYLA